MHPTGIEPITYSSVDCRSIQLSYGCFLPRSLTICNKPVLARLNLSIFDAVHSCGAVAPEGFLKLRPPRLERSNLTLPTGFCARGNAKSQCILPTRTVRLPATRISFAGEQ